MWSEVLLDSWSVSAQIFNDQEWAFKLIPHMKYGIAALLSILDPPKRDILLMEAIKLRSDIDDPTSYYALMINGMFDTREALFSKPLTEPLGAEVSRAALLSMKADRSLDMYRNSVLTALPSLALRLHPSCADEALSGWSESYMKNPYARNIMNYFMETVQFRREMQLALQE
jgi:hypothetical protein